MKRISIQLQQTKLDRSLSRASLGEVMEEAQQVLHPNGNVPEREAQWLARIAVRAVCKEIIRNKGIVLPLEVKFANSPADDPEQFTVPTTEATKEWRSLESEVPSVFFDLASFYQIEPGRLANALIYQFCLHSPKNLTIVSRQSEDMPPDDSTENGRF